MECLQYVPEIEVLPKQYGISTQSGLATAYQGNTQHILSIPLLKLSNPYTQDKINLAQHLYWRISSEKSL